MTYRGYRNYSFVLIIVWLVMNMNVCAGADSHFSANEKTSARIREFFSIVEELDHLRVVEETTNRTLILDKQVPWNIQEKYHPQIFAILDRIIADPDCTYEDFSKAIYLKNFFICMVDDFPYHKLRDFVESIDPEKYPQLAFKLWVKFLDYRLDSARIFSDNPEDYEEAIVDIRKELQKYGKDMPPGIANLGIEVIRIEYDNEWNNGKSNYKAIYDEFSKMILESTSEEVQNLFQEFQKRLSEREANGEGWRWEDW